MKLFVSIDGGALIDIISEKKKDEYRQIESITFVDPVDGSALATFKVKGITNCAPIQVQQELKKYGLQKHFKSGLPSIRIRLGERID